MELACRDDNLSLFVLIAMAICLDNLLQECRRPPRLSSSSFGHPEFHRQGSRLLHEHYLVPSLLSFSGPGPG